MQQLQVQFNNNKFARNCNAPRNRRMNLAGAYHNDSNANANDPCGSHFVSNELSLTSGTQFCLATSSDNQIIGRRGSLASELFGSKQIRSPRRRRRRAPFSGQPYCLFINLGPCETGARSLADFERMRVLAQLVSCSHFRHYRWPAKMTSAFFCKCSEQI